jgi:hypothetical protein
MALLTGTPHLVLYLKTLGAAELPHAVPTRATVERQPSGEVQNRFVQSKVQPQLTRPIQSQQQSQPHVQRPFLEELMVSFISLYPNPTLYIKIVGPGDYRHNNTWFAPRSVVQLVSETAALNARWLGPKEATPDSRFLPANKENEARNHPPSGGGVESLAVVHFLIKFLPIAPNVEHRVHIRVEFKSRDLALHQTDRNPSYGPLVGVEVEGSPVVVVPKPWPGYQPPSPVAADKESGDVLPECADPTGHVGPDGVWQMWPIDGGDASKMERGGDPDDVVSQKCVKGGKRYNEWGRRGCQMKRYNAKCLLNMKGVVLLGDSLMRYTYYQLACELRALGVTEYELARALQYSNTKGPLPNYMNDQIQRACHTSHDDLRIRSKEAKRVFEDGEAIDRGWHTLALNPSGVWQASFGLLGSWELYVHKVLDAALDAGFKRIIWMGTTAVHPTHYLWHNSPTSKMKKHLSLTNPRIEEVNAYMAKVAKARGIEMVDFYTPTLLREDDPMDKSDMRHYGQNTVHEIVQLLLRGICAPTPLTEMETKAEAVWNPEKLLGLIPFDKDSPCDVNYKERDYHSYMHPCDSKAYPGFRGWACVVPRNLTVDQAYCLGDPDTLNSCPRVLEHAKQKVGKLNPKDAHEGALLLAGSVCKCADDELIKSDPRVAAYYSAKTGPFESGRPYLANGDA